MGGIAVRAEPKQVSGRYRMGAVTQIKDLDSAPNRPAFTLFSVLPCRKTSTSLLYTKITNKSI